MSNRLSYYAIYKPFGMLSQFTSESGHETLKKLFDFPSDVYPVGRLDTDSEGLLVLTNDKQLNHLLLNPGFAHHRAYLVQVEGEVTGEACSRMESGVNITVNGKKHVADAVEARSVEPPVWLPERNPPIRFRKSVPTSWLELVLQEGKNRQVRKMTAAAGFPTLRLIRTRIEKLTLDHMKPGEVKSLTRQETYSLLNIR
jgi:23S rRNA pseudouridine2457 synthase